MMPTPIASARVMSSMTCAQATFWHGHYHVRYDVDLDLGWSGDQPGWIGVCHVHGLDRDESHRAANLALVDAAGELLPQPDLT